MTTSKEKQRQYEKKSYLKHRDKRLAHHRKLDRQRWLKLKLEVLTNYSQGIPTCYVCGETNILCLSLDHIDNNGSQQLRALGVKSGIPFYRWLKKQDFPKNLNLQVLCMNCQYIKRFYAEEVRQKKLDSKFKSGIDRRISEWKRQNL